MSDKPSEAVVKLANGMQDYSHRIIGAPDFSWPKDRAERKARLAEIEKGEVQEWAMLIQQFLDEQLAEYKAKALKEWTRAEEIAEYAALKEEQPVEEGITVWNVPKVCNTCGQELCSGSFVNTCSNWKPR